MYTFLQRSQPWLLPLPRLFTGILLPPSLQPDLLALLSESAQLRPARLGQLHLTLHFAGLVSDDASSHLQRELAAIRCSCFRMVLTDTGVFRQESGFRGVLWAGVQPSEQLLRLYSAVTAAAQSAGLSVESRPWSPHITLARYAGGPPKDLPLFLRRGRGLQTEFEVMNFQLLESRPGPTGSVYVPLAVFPLG